MYSRRGQGRARKTRSLWLGAMIQLLFLFCFVFDYVIENTARGGRKTRSLLLPEQMSPASAFTPGLKHPTASSSSSSSPIATRCILNSIARALLVVKIQIEAQMYVHRMQPRTSCNVSGCLLFWPSCSLYTPCVIAVVRPHWLRLPPFHIALYAN